MNNFIFQNSTKVYFGKGCVKEYLACLTKNANTILLAYGGGSIKKNGVYDEITDILKDAGKTIVEFSGIMSNPTYAKVQEGAKLARENHVDMILAVGGGSTMDCCKAVSLAARYDGNVWNDFWAQPGVIDFAPLPLGVVVTVAGTGSECNGGAVITNEEKKVKTGRDYPALNPRFALMDPTFTFSVPKPQMISGSFDILSHIMETYFSAPNEDNVSDDIMEALMKNVIRNLRAAIQNPEDYIARSNLMWDATMAENRLIKMGKRCDFECHNMEHQLGAYTNCNHGCGLAVAQAVAAAIDEIYERTGQDSILVTHSQGGLPGWEVPRYTEHVAAIVAIEPGGAPQADSDAYNALLEQNIPIAFYYGDYIGEEFTDVPAAAMWTMMASGADVFTESYNTAGGNSTVVRLPEEGITGNSHFMFQELNNDVIADHIETWIQKNISE